ncbi:hypothetical protein [Mollivirus kamchatka]|nr:hypothetical protein [Mollivirus kamchatka]
MQTHAEMDSLPREMVSHIASFIADHRPLRLTSKKWKEICDSFHPPHIFALLYGRAVESRGLWNKPIPEDLKEALLGRCDGLPCFSAVGARILPYDFYTCFGAAKFENLARKERCPKCDLHPNSCECTCSCSRQAHPVDACPDVTGYDLWSDDYHHLGPRAVGAYRNASLVYERYDKMTYHVGSVARTPSVDHYARTKAKDAAAVAYLGRCIQRLVHWGHLREDHHLSKLSCSAIIRRAHKANDMWNCVDRIFSHNYCDECSTWYYGDKRCFCDNVRLCYHADQVELDPNYSIDSRHHHGHVESW